MKQAHAAHLTTLGLGLLALVGCVDPDEVAVDVAAAYVAPMLVVDDTDCAGSLERAKAAVELTRPRWKELRSKREKVRDKDRFRASFDGQVSAARKRSGGFVPACLSEAREIGTLMDEAAEALGVSDLVEPWPHAPLSRAVHRCMRAGTCEEYRGPGESQNVRRFVCEEVGGTWSLEACPTANASGRCRYGVGSATESAFTIYGPDSQAQAKSRCLTTDRSRPGPGSWDPFPQPRAIVTAPSAAAPKSTMVVAPSRAAAVAPGKGPRPAPPKSQAPDAPY